VHDPPGVTPHVSVFATLSTMIEVANLTKVFKVHRRRPGFWPALTSLFRRTYEDVHAVSDVSFRVERGERVGFLGPNGAGKTTTLKVLSGLLHPTAGHVRVSGFDPSRREREFLASITLVMGQKQQLMWDLPPLETYDLNRAIFDVPRPKFDAAMKELGDLLGLDALSDKPTRQLSLGERMRCELAAALLHGPSCLFLDEPTIGLDVSMQVAIREFIRAYNERHEATVLLTSHYMEDVTALCPRVIVIDRGALIHDGDLRGLVETVHPDKLVSFSLTAPVTPDQLSRLGAVTLHEAGRAVLRVPRARLREVVGHSLAHLPVADLTVEDPPLEDIMRQLFQSGSAARAGDDLEARGKVGRA
jgi:ABC-2 type transport system ATP-binding protein